MNISTAEYVVLNWFPDVRNITLDPPLDVIVLLKPVFNTWNFPMTILYSKVMSEEGANLINWVKIKVTMDINESLYSLLVVVGNQQLINFIFKWRILNRLWGPLFYSILKTSTLILTQSEGLQTNRLIHFKLYLALVTQIEFTRVTRSA